MSDPQYEAYLREGDQREENLRLRAEIERLRAARANDEYKWRAALEEVVRLRLNTNEGTCAQRFDRAWEVARRVLEGK